MFVAFAPKYLYFATFSNY